MRSAFRFILDTDDDGDFTVTFDPLVTFQDGTTTAKLNQGRTTSVALRPDGETGWRATVEPI